MVNRRDFFSGFLKPDRRKPAVRPARAPRMRSLETFVVADVIPDDVNLTPEEDRELRSRVRTLLEATSDPDLFSMAVVAKLEALGETFVREVEANARNGSEPAPPEGGGAESGGSP